jgi:hypothetical protein
MLFSEGETINEMLLSVMFCSLRNVKESLKRFFWPFSHRDQRSWPGGYPPDERQEREIAEPFRRYSEEGDI